MTSFAPRSLIAASLLLCALPASGATLTATAATFAAVFASVKSGDTIKLSGTFGLTKLSDRTFAKAVTIDATKAVFTDTLSINNVNGLSFVGGEYGSSSVATHYGKAVAVSGGSNIFFAKAIVVGAATGQGISFEDSTTVGVRDSTFTGLHAGVSMSGVTDGSVYMNKSIGAVSDGFDVAGSHNVRVRANSCSGTSPSAGAHADCVQLWSILGKPVQSDILIMDNTATGNTQGFTSFTPANGGGLRISIIGNHLNTAFPQGIACYGCVDSTITGNTVMTAVGAAHKTSINVVGGSNNTVASNTFGYSSASSTVASTFTAVATRSLVTARIANTGLEGVSPQSAVPEPDVWAMMVVGFGAMGIAMRRRNRPTRSVAA